MKKMFVVLSLLMSFVLLPLAAFGQNGNIISFSLFGPTMKILVVNDTSDNTQILTQIDFKKAPGLLSQGAQWGRGFGFASSGQIPILVQMCQGTETVYHRNTPPDWTREDRLGSLALTDEYLSSERSRSNLQQRVKDLKHFIHDDITRKREEAELNDWLKQMADGFTSKQMNCELPKTLGALTFNWAQWNGDGQTQVVMIMVHGSHTTGYQLDYPKYIYSSMY
jgi:hypothetical protein